jgi:hypothetical protein
MKARCFLPILRLLLLLTNLLVSAVDVSTTGAGIGAAATAASHRIT